MITSIFCDVKSLPVNIYFKKCHMLFLGGRGVSQKPRITTMGEGSKWTKKEHVVCVPSLSLSNFFFSLVFNAHNHREFRFALYNRFTFELRALLQMVRLILCCQVCCHQWIQLKAATILSVILEPSLVVSSC